MKKQKIYLTPQEKKLRRIGKSKDLWPGAKEWCSSVYNYNKEETKGEWNKQKAALRLIKGHLNLYSRVLDKGVNYRRSRKYRARTRKLSGNRILTGTIESKQTNDRVKLTIYIYDTKKASYKNIIKKRSKIMSPGRLGFKNKYRSYIRAGIVKRIGRLIHKKLSESKITGYGLEYKTLLNYYVKALEMKLGSNWGSKRKLKKSMGGLCSRLKWWKHLHITAEPRVIESINEEKRMCKLKLAYIKSCEERLYKLKEEDLNEEKFEEIEEIYSNLIKLLVRESYTKKEWQELYKRKTKQKIQEKKEMKARLREEIESLNEETLAQKLDKLKEELKTLRSKLKVKILIEEYKKNHKEWIEYHVRLQRDKDRKTIILRKAYLVPMYKRLMSFHKMKFQRYFIRSLEKEVKKIYNKAVIFNFVNLKYLHMDSRLISEGLVTKVRKKKMHLYYRLKSMIKRFRVPAIDRLKYYDERYYRSLISQDPRLKKGLQKADIIDGSLERYIPEFPSNWEKSQLLIYTKGLWKYMEGLRYKLVKGMRLELSGRLTKRIKAARSLFKLRYKGNLRNTLSSDQGSTAIMLRGYAKSNVQYNFTKGKRKIGSFGVKVWISGY